jgi:hypothetical protein
MYVDPAQQPVVWNGRYFPGAEHLTVGQLERELLRGGRFAYFSWCYSVLVWTFRRNTQVRFYRVGQEGGDALKWTFLSLAAGPWSIVGPIMSLICTFHNLAGGTDVSGEVTAALLGPARAQAILRRRGKPPVSVAVGVMRIVMIVLPLLLAGGLVGGYFYYRKHSQPPTPPPGYAEYVAIREKVAAVPGESGGNNEMAVRLAKLTVLEVDRALGDSLKRFAIGQPNARARGYSLWCELGETQCLFFMRVPHLSEISDETQKRMAQSVWDCVQEVLKDRDEVRGGIGLSISVDESGPPQQFSPKNAVPPGQLFTGVGPAGQPRTVVPPRAKLTGQAADESLRESCRIVASQPRKEPAPDEK